MVPQIKEGYRVTIRPYRVGGISDIQTDRPPNGKRSNYYRFPANSIGGILRNISKW
jgi:hypothetical protein